MTDNVPADWYDDPEDPSRYRYWDGERWTDHRAAKGTRAARRRSDSAWSVVGSSFGLLGARWRAFAVLGGVMAVVNGVAAGAGYAALDSFFDGRFDEVYDRVSAPGFDPNSAASESFFESLDVGVTAPFVVWMAVATVVGVVGLAAAAAGVMRLTAGSMATDGRAPTAGRAVADGCRRAGWVVLMAVVYGVAAAAGIFVAIVVAALFPPTLIVTVPGLIAAIVWIVPMSSMSFVAAAAGPRVPDPLPTGWRLASRQWRRVAARVGAVILVGIAVNFGANLATTLGQLLGPVGLLLLSVVGGAAVTVAQATMLATVYVDVGGEVDPDLCQPINA